MRTKRAARHHRKVEKTLTEVPSATEAPRRPVSSPPCALNNIDPALTHTWLPVARAGDVAEAPVGVWLLGRPLVVARLGAKLLVLDDRCPHRGAPLSAGAISGDTISCAYHGWRFDDGGRCVEVPSQDRKTPIPPKAHCGTPLAAVERFGLIFVSLGTPLIELPDVPALADPDRTTVHLTPFSGRYGAAQLIDNQLDVSHFPFLHGDTFGSPDGRGTVPPKLESDPWGFSFSLSSPILANNDPGVAAGVRPLAQHRMMRYRYRAPFFVELELTYPVMGGSNVIVFFVQPETLDRATLYCICALEQPGGFTSDELEARIAFEYRIIAEDLALQERFHDLALPLDPRAECHVRADRPALEYRRLLAQLVAASQGQP
jgi:phenylpropionate dioxygenase-like ring-hydroxylating dioxygenase large terminal subunit